VWNVRGPTIHGYRVPSSNTKKFRRLYNVKRGERERHTHTHTLTVKNSEGFIIWRGERERETHTHTHIQIFQEVSHFLGRREWCSHRTTKFGSQLFRFVKFSFWVTCLMAYYVETGRSQPPNRLTIRVTLVSHFLGRREWCFQPSNSWKLPMCGMGLV
jgi:hypothetical protein